MAAESLGVRSMALMVETPDLRILLDASAALGMRQRLLPHPSEYLALRESRKRIVENAEKADIITISHYHFDHYTATWKSLEVVSSWSSYDEARRIYGGKTVYAKDYRSSINPSQRRRGYLFSKIASDFIGKLQYSDSKKVTVGDTTIKFTKPLLHGEEDSGLGYVIGAMISHGDSTLMFCPDVQGPMNSSTLRLIIRTKPDVLVIGGPPEYLSGYKVPEDMIKRGMGNLGKLAAQVPLTIAEHHLLRSMRGLGWLDDLKKIAAENGNRMCSAADYLGVENRLLEANRSLLYEEEPPAQEFQKWVKMSPLRRGSLPPPL